MKSQYRCSLLAAAAYLLLTVLMTWPTALHLTRAIPGDGFDGWQNYWNLWWVKQALLIEQTNPYFTHFLDAPTGVSLLFHTLNIFNGLWTLPLQLNFGLAVAYNSVVFLSFTLAGYGGYLLALHTLRHLFPAQPGLRPAAFVAGLIFTMSPFHMAHLLGHMQVFTMIWPPFYILWLLRTLTPRPKPGNVLPSLRDQLRNAAIACLFLILATLVDWYHTLYLLMFTGLLLLWIFWQKRRQLRSGRLGVNHPLVRPVLITAAIGFGFGVTLAPLLLPMLRDASARPDLETGLVQNITLSADLLAFVLPSEMHPLWGRWAAALADNFTSTTSERLVFAGFTPLALGLLALFKTGSRRAVKFWGLLLAFFGVMALGPYLHINGQIVSIGGWPLPLPYLLLYHTVPFIDLTRSLSRYDLMVMLCLGVLAAVALVWLQLRLGGGRQTVPVWPSLLAGALICVEFLAAPYPLSPIDTPQFYHDIGAQPGDYVVAELPMNWDRPTPLLHQTAHRKRLLTAYTSRDNPLELAWRTPVFQHWQNLGPDIIDQPLAKIAPTIFFDFNLRYVVLDYWQMPPGPERSETERWVAAALPNAAPIYDDGRLRVFQTPPKQETSPYLSLGLGWGNLTRMGDGQSVRAVPGDGAELFIHHAPSPLTLTITAAAPGPPQHLTIFAGNIPLDIVSVGEIFQPITVSLPPTETPLLKLYLVPTDVISISRLYLHEIS